METTEKVDKLTEMFMQKQEKYVYYILALNVAAIGFAITQVIKLEATWTLIPAGIAMLFWSISFFLGIQFILLGISTIYDNLNTLHYVNPNHPKYVNRHDSNEITNEILEEIQNRASSKSVHYFNYLLYCFYAGSISMIVWVFIYISN